MAIVIVPVKKKKSASKGGGGMDIATKKDALINKVSKTLKAAMKKEGISLSDQDVKRVWKSLQTPKKEDTPKQPKQPKPPKKLPKKKPKTPQQKYFDEVMKYKGRSGQLDAEGRKNPYALQKTNKGGKVKKKK